MENEQITENEKRLIIEKVKTEKGLNEFIKAFYKISETDKDLRLHFLNVVNAELDYEKFIFNFNLIAKNRLWRLNHSSKETLRELRKEDLRKELAELEHIDKMEICPI